MNSKLNESTKTDQDDASNEAIEDDREPIKSSDESDDHDESDEDVNSTDRYWPPPTSESVEIVCSNSGKIVSALAFNHSGTRFAAGSHDYGVRIWDFQALDPVRPRPIASTEPNGQTVIKSLDYSANDELLLVISGYQAVIMAKDGIVSRHHQCPKGDQYLSDMNNTKGHVQLLNDGCWNPKDKAQFITCSGDGTIRIWDLEDLSKQKTVIKTRSPTSGLRAAPSRCKFSRDSLSIVAGCNDGTIMIWDTRRKFISTSSCIKGAHLKGSEITGLDYSYGMGKLCSRSEDESCKLWDLRKLKTPLASQTSLPNLYSGTDCCFSPSDSLVLTGTSRDGKCSPGELLFLDALDGLATRHRVEVAGGGVVRSIWEPRINHVAYSCSNGSIHVAHDKLRSQGGLLLAAGAPTARKRKRYPGLEADHQESAGSLAKKIITPHSLPLFRDQGAGGSSFAKIRQDPRRSYKPEVPAGGASEGGHVKAAGSTLSSYIARNIAKPKDDGGMDIRQRLLRHADEAERDPRWVKPAPQSQQQQQQPPPPQQPQ